MAGKSIVIAGVGGQGLITIGTVVAQALIRKGYSVRVGEVHGLSQRGGSVVVFLKYGQGPLSPIVDQGEADVLLGLELIETLRRVPLLSKEGVVLANNFFLPPPAAKSPSRSAVLNALKGLGARVVLLEADELALKAGSPITVNMVMLGALIGTGRIDLTLEDAADVLRSRFKGKVLEMNLEALKLGYTAAQEQLEGQRL
ncbi:indolepyruvate oxidoreductase subunit beta [Thermofilum pendens]|uniref:Indolepyruvate ferredoxin oxidoreductase, subunit iorB n=1 Tax=Thermofilum pendens (strain DSM 2475 / Hrk 5) TaxID=368408 RepID=A1RYA4_THEPD|nr:indolepyruvate oxidoreductase subunit beta [Thermofilum pendens]ABL78184.1 indolepyruvate ferredoxin oxidoreductase, subunit iorB [Thermofilum pendens Hrk 5]